MKANLAVCRNTGFFALRTPLLPYEQFLALSAGIEPPSSGMVGRADRLASDRESVRAAMRAAVRDPIVREALFLASPTLDASLPVWEAAPDSETGRKVEVALYRYLARMCTRSTPFGLCAGISRGRMTKTTRLTLAPRTEYQRFTRLDNDYLCLLLETINATPSFRVRATYVVNSSAYVAGDKLRYLEATSEGREHGRGYRLVAVQIDEHVTAVLTRARTGATLADLTAALTATDPDLEDVEASAFVHALIDNQILVSGLELAVTGREPLDDALNELAAGGETAVSARLSRLRERVRALDVQGLGVPREAYEQIHRDVATLPVRDVDPNRLFQVNLAKPLIAADLGRDLLIELRAALTALYRITRPPSGSAASRWAEQFLDRYGDSVVPLAEALDSETGLELERDELALDASPLLEGLDLDDDVRDERWVFGLREVHLLGLLNRAWHDRQREIVLDEADVAALEIPEKPPLPTSFSAMFRLARTNDSPSGHEMLFMSAHGPSGARLLGRFCHDDPELTRSVRDHLQAEEATRPEAVFAEIVHLPEGRMGNVSCRPVLRGYEIPYLGKSGAAGDRRLALEDLALCVRDGRLIVWSRALGKEVVPRLTNAHNASANTVRLYKFLAELEQQGCTPMIGWSWGPLSDAPHLPRVRLGSVIVARECWTLSARQVDRLRKARGLDRHRLVTDLRDSRGLPRYVVLRHGDNELAVDLDNTIAVDAMTASMAAGTRAQLCELWPAPGSALIEGPEGRYSGEFIVPFVHANEQASASRSPPGLPRTVSSPSGSCGQSDPSWSALRLEAGASAVDEVLGALLPEIRGLVASGTADRWFFRRASRPRSHVQVALHARNHDDVGAIVVRMHDRARELHRDRKILGWSIESYLPDHERFGGTDAVRLAEEASWIDSEAVAALIDRVLPDAEELRWFVALYGIDTMLSDFGYDEVQRLELADGLKVALRRELHRGPRLEKQLAERFRDHMAPVRAWLEGTSRDPAFGGVRTAYAVRSRRLIPVVAALRDLDARGLVSLPFDRLVRQLLRDSTNRVFRSAAAAHELVVYDILRRAYMSQLGRGTSLEKRAGTAHP